MSETKKTKQKVIILAALVLLFFSRWAFYYLELYLLVNNIIFVSECVFFLVIYGMIVFDLKSLFPIICLFGGCAGMCCLYAFSEGSAKGDALLPLTYFPVFFFLIDQSCLKTEKKNSSFFEKARIVLMNFYLWGFAALVVWYGVVDRPVLSSFSIFAFVIFICTGIIYFLIMQSQPSNQERGMKGHRHQSVKRMRFVFLFAVVSIIETCFFLQLSGKTELIHTVPLLWVVNLPVLSLKEHPLVKGFGERFLHGLNSFFAD